MVDGWSKVDESLSQEGYFGQSTGDCWIWTHEFFTSSSFRILLSDATNGGRVVVVDDACSSACFLEFWSLLLLLLSLSLSSDDNSVSVSSSEDVEMELSSASRLVEPSAVDYIGTPWVRIVSDCKKEQFAGGWRCMTL